jgi:hypothetical protein
MLCSLSNLKKEQIEAIQSLEKRLGKALLAYSCNEAGMASVNDDDLKEIKNLENRLGIALVAVKT